MLMLVCGKSRSAWESYVVLFEKHDVQLKNEKLHNIKEKKLKTTKNNRQITLPVEFIDTLFYYYSSNGLGYSQTQMINKFNLKTWEWNSIKSRLSLTKLSHIFSPYTVENTPKDQLGNMIEEKMNKLFSQVGYQVEEKYNKTLLKTYKKKLTELTDQELQIQTIITELADLLPTIEFPASLLLIFTSEV
jgi:phage terminase large subunit GpA-like protein